MTIDEMLKSASIKTAAEKIQSILASKTARDEAPSPRERLQQILASKTAADAAPSPRERLQQILASKTASDPAARIAAVVEARNARQQ